MTSLAERIEEINYFEMLNIDINAPTSLIQTTFFNFAKKWHPDRLSEALKPLKPWVEIVFSHVNEAYQCLMDEEKRMRYIQNVQEGGGTLAADRRVQQIFDSAIEFQKVEMLVRQRNWDQALEMLQKVINMYSEEADYHAMKAWILLEKHTGKEAPLEEILSATETALKHNRRHERANMCQALALKQAGREKEAIKFFKTVTEINPHNVEAAREVYLSGMRKEGKFKTPSAKPQQEGVFSKLFKKK